MTKEYIVAVVGATGAVGEEMLIVLEEMNIPIKKLVPLASARSAGKKVTFKNEEIEVKELTKDIFEEEKIQIALFSAGGSISQKFAPYAAKAGAVVIDNTSFFRMDKDIPLVVPEVNPQDITLWKNKGIIANPNCSTIQMVTALSPLDKEFGIRRVDVSTYQAVSGAGKSAIDELMNQTRDLLNFDFENTEVNKFTKKIVINAIPHIDKFFDSGYTKEEIKMVEESQKIMHKNFELSATCVRVPVLKGHSEAVTIWFEDIVHADDAREILSQAPGVVVMDKPFDNVYPTPLDSVDKNETFVGRIRNDLYNKSVLHLWVVADNLRVGAATNAVRIAKEWIKMQEN
jgi:aspartate-semialdehyde dehydrogenase